MNTLILEPDIRIAPYVKSVWIVENDSLSLSVPAIPFYADGYPGIIYQHSQYGMMLNNTRKLSSLFLYGQTVKPIELNPSGQFRMIIFLLYPYVTKAIFRINSHEITDDCLDLGLLPSNPVVNILEKLQETDSAQKQVELISQCLFRFISLYNIEIDRALHYAVSFMMKSKGSSSIKTLREYLKIPERTFERKFEQHVGVSPKLFARICQFQGALTQLKLQQYEKLSDIAYDNGYADQSHFIRSFRDFTGFSPFEFQKIAQSQND